MILLSGEIVNIHPKDRRREDVCNPFSLIFLSFLLSEN